MEFEKQITNVKLVIDRTPRVYLKWTNTEKGRDRNDCYERIVNGDSVIYINTYNRNLSVICGNPFWDKLEKIYNNVLVNKTKDSSDENLNMSDVSECKKSKVEEYVIVDMTDGSKYPFYDKGSNSFFSNLPFATFFKSLDRAEKVLKLTQQKHQDKNLQILNVDDVRC